jgi:hypothetical protein
MGSRRRRGQELPLVADLHRLGVQQGPIVKPDVSTQGEGVGESVGALLPAFGQGRPHLGAVGRQVGEAIVQQPYHPVGLHAVGLPRIQGVGFAGEELHEGALLRNARPCGSAHDPHQGQAERHQDPSGRTLCASCSACRAPHRVSSSHRFLPPSVPGPGPSADPQQGCQSRMRRYSINRARSAGPGRVKRQMWWVEPALHHIQSPLGLSTPIRNLDHP